MRHLLVKDIHATVSEFAQACELLSATFGETGKECAESYYYYGKALLELSRLESGILGNALDGVPEEDDEANSSKVEDPAKMTDEEKKEVEEKVGEALKENFVQLEKKVETETEAARKEETSESEKDENADAKQKDDDDEGMDVGDESQESSNNEQMETDKVVDGEKRTASKEDDEKTEGK